jgi:hypothetical protein
MTTTLSTLNASEAANSDLRGNGVIICAASAVSLAIALYLVECSRDPLLLQDAATSSAGP